MHSIYSDGTCLVEEILKQAKELGLTQIAITDHNIIDGAIKARELAEEIDFIVGTELSVGYHENEVHLLGLFPDGSPSNYYNVLRIIREAKAYKKVAIVEMIENLNKIGIDITLNEVYAKSVGDINRVHIIKAMMDHGYVESVKEGFDKYIGEHCPSYVERQVITIKEACECIHDDGGFAVIAHPYEYKRITDRDAFLNEIMPYIDGIECFHPSATPENSAHLLELVEKNGKFATGGSDFHGANKPNIFMGMMKVDDKYSIKHKQTH